MFSISPYEGEIVSICPSSTPCPLKHIDPVSVSQFDDGSIVISVFTEGVYDELEITDIAKRGRNRGAVKIGTQRQMVDPDAVDNV